MHLFFPIFFFNPPSVSETFLRLNSCVMKRLFFFPPRGRVGREEGVFWCCRGSEHCDVVFDYTRGPSLRRIAADSGSFEAAVDVALAACALSHHRPVRLVSCNCQQLFPALKTRAHVRFFSPFI